MFQTFTTPAGGRVESDKTIRRNSSALQMNQTMKNILGSQGTQGGPTRASSRPATDQTIKADMSGTPFLLLEQNGD